MTDHDERGAVVSPLEAFKAARDRAEDDWRDGLHDETERETLVFDDRDPFGG